MSKIKNASKLILEHLEKIGRPDNLQGISNNVIEVGKADVQRALTALVEDERIKEKTYGKVKIYYINQKERNKGKQVDVSKLDQMLNERRETLKELNNSIKEKESSLKEYTNKLSKKELEEEIKTYEIKVKELEIKLKELDESKKKANEKENKYKKYDYEQVSNECRKRKRITKNIIDSIVEFGGKKKKQLLEDIGIDFYN